MSTWKDIPDENLSIDYDNCEINVLVGSDDSGNNYVTFSWDRLETLYESIYKTPTCTKSESE